MDPHRFDELARTLGAAHSRRGVMRALRAGALGIVGLTGLSREAAARPAGKVTICHLDNDLGVYKQLSVSENAVRAHLAHGDGILNDDANHCGICGNVCPTPANSTATCTDGQCGFTCLEGFAECNGACVDHASDPANCGGCGNACPTGFCTSSECVTCPKASDDSSYSGSCWSYWQECTPRGMELSAMCPSQGGQPNQTSIIVNTCADANYVIANCNGTLTCGGC